MDVGITQAIIAAITMVLIALAGWAWRQHLRAITEAEQRALATARSEALIREANTALDKKTDEITTLKAVSAADVADVRGQLSTCQQANAELRQLLLQCTRRTEGEAS